MFSFFKKRPVTSYPLQVITRDIHSHILPGIDDGSPDVETSLQLVKGLIRLGITETVATPHIIGDLYRNTTVTIFDALYKLQTACEKENISIKISAAAEYMIDDYFLELLRNKEPLLTIYGNYVLTELTYTSPIYNLEEISFTLTTSGYQPILAHPERYFYYHNDFDTFFRLKELGFLLQVNLLSFTGYYGKEVAKAARFIVDNNLMDFTGTDMHHTRHLEALCKRSNQLLIQKATHNRMYNKF